jgi:hypothetical protein
MGAETRLFNNLSLLKSKNGSHIRAKTAELGEHGPYFLFWRYDRAKVARTFKGQNGPMGPK